ncbi:MAG TPA: hypothetical protein VMT52_10530, partial [Planctomycetota bacterium]|nr:hypothetical protein [Planctomycetota bacterium]
FQGSQRISFSQLIPGDKVFVFTPDNKGEAAVGQAAQSAGNSLQLARFPSGDYTVKTNLSGLLEFEEDFDTTAWASKPQTGVYYKAGFVPSAVRITLRVVDDKGFNPKTMQREVWIRRRSR